MKIGIRWTMLVGAIWLGGLATGAQAHPGHSHRKTKQSASKSETTVSERAWTGSAGEFRETGSFVAVKQGNVQIRRADDSLVSWPLSQLSTADQKWVASRLAEIRDTNENAPVPGKPLRVPIHLVSEITDQQLERQEVERMAAKQLQILLAQVDRKQPRTAVPRANGKAIERVPDMAQTFAAFVKLKAIRTRWDETYFYVESKGIPDHRMMVGITSWQQQVPLPQAYTGENAWRIPLHPVPAKNPQSTRNNFLRGAIAVAANGVAIFNPLNNRGDDAFLFGELDEFGGHCGRADDYHYHLPPVHLQKTVGKGLPIAYALDGYPIYGYEEPDGSQVVGLDEFNGHEDAQGRYHYHATKEYPYLNGGFHGEVTERDGQVDPQPRAQPLRPDLRPLRDAKITDFVETKPGTFRLTYDINGEEGTVSYTLAADGSAKFTFIDTRGISTHETYTPRRRGPDGDDRPPPPRPGDAPPPRDGQRRPPRREERISELPRREGSTNVDRQLPKLVVTSSALDDQGFISSEFTCDGDSASPPVEWKDAPKGTKFFALSLWHTAPDQEKSYWVVYNIPAKIGKIDKNVQGIGKLGLNDKRRAAYDPMCSKGPGVKTYHITVYALSAEPKLTADQATRANLLEAIQDITLAEGTLDFQYERNRKQ